MFNWCLHSNYIYTWGRLLGRYSLFNLNYVGKHHVLINVETVKQDFHSYYCAARRRPPDRRDATLEFINQSNFGKLFSEQIYLRIIFSSSSEPAARLVVFGKLFKLNKNGEINFRKKSVRTFSTFNACVSKLIRVLKVSKVNVFQLSKWIGSLKSNF